MFIVDDLSLLVAVITASMVAGGSGASLYTNGGNKTTRTFTNSKTGTKRTVKLDGKLKGIDPENTIGHVTNAGPDYGKPVGSTGEIISADATPIERLGIGSYDAVAISESVSKAMKQMLNPRGADGIFKKTAKYGNMGTLTSDILKDQKAMKKYMDTLLSGGKVFDPSKMPTDKIIEILKNPNNIAPIIQADTDKYKAIWDVLNDIAPKYKIQPTIDEPWTTTKTADGEGGDGGEGGDDEIDHKHDGDGSGKVKIPDPEKPLPIPDIPDTSDPDPDKPPDRPDKPDEDGPEKRQPKDDDKKKKPKPKPLPGPQEVQEKEIETLAKQKPKRQQAPQQWYPQYSFGGQNLLKMTDVEKLEELKNWTLFDLVNPLLDGDRNNLLAIQNRLKEKMRFSNTYPNPRPERQLPPIPANFNSGYEMKNTMPTPYPFTLDQAHANNYYDNFCYEYATELNKNMDGLKRDHTYSPEISKIMNSTRTGYTATDPQIMNHQNTKPSLLEGLDSSSISMNDIMMLR